MELSTLLLLFPFKAKLSQGPFFQALGGAWLAEGRRGWDEEWPTGLLPMTPTDGKGAPTALADWLVKGFDGSTLEASEVTVVSNGCGSCFACCCTGVPLVAVGALDAT